MVENLLYGHLHQTSLTDVIVIFERIKDTTIKIDSQYERDTGEEYHTISSQRPQEIVVRVVLSQV